MIRAITYKIKLDELQYFIAIVRIKYDMKFKSYETVMIYSKIPYIHIKYKFYWTCSKNSTLGASNYAFKCGLILESLVPSSKKCVKSLSYFDLRLKSSG